MNNIQNVNPNIASTLATQSGQAEAQAAAAKEVSPLLGGQSVTVSHAPSTDLEKLVARLKNEESDRKTSMAKQRLASVLDAYVSRYGELSSEQAKILEDIAANNDSIADLSEELKKALADKAAAEGQAAVMQAKIDQLTRAIEQAVEDGKIHRENVAKLKEQLAKDQDNEDLKAQLEKEEKALAQSEAALSKAETDRAAAQAQAGALSAKIESLAGTAEKLKGDIAALEKSNETLTAKLDPKVVTDLLAAFSAADTGVQPPERNVSNAAEEKAEAKAIANNPANLLREAMDRMDAAILQTIDENREEPV
jgi:chromosome segregation ATPase